MMELFLSRFYLFKPSTKSIFINRVVRKNCILATENKHFSNVQELLLKMILMFRNS